MDVSADLEALAGFPLVVVCAGAKAILDIPRTLEVLETKGVPIIGYRTDEFPAFYSRSCGLAYSVDMRCENAQEIADIAAAHVSFGLQSSLLVAQPVCAEDELPASKMKPAVAAALVEAGHQGISGKDLTPFLLAKIASITDGQSQIANLSLLRQNARLAAEIAVCGAEMW
jgi:pseudouridine-5'-phosphate glycosidase